MRAHTHTNTQTLAMFMLLLFHVGRIAWLTLSMQRCQWLV